MLSSLFGLGIFLVIGTVASNFLFHTLRPDWSRKKHVICSSMLPSFGLWLLVTMVLGFTVLPGNGVELEFLVPAVVLAILLPFLGALIGIPTSWMILKQMNWKNPGSLDDIFK